MVTLLETQVTEILTSYLGRAPTVEEIRLGSAAPNPLARMHNTTNVAENTISISPTSSDSIQDAIDKINDNGGGVVYLNPGTYNENSDITIPSNVYLIGLAKNLCIIDFGNSSRSIITTGTSDITLMEFTVQNSTDSGIKILNNTGLIVINNVDVDDCLIGIEVTNCLFGINIISGGVFITNCDVGLKFDTVSGFTIDNSTFSLCDTYGMELIDTSFGIVRACGFQANTDDAINCSNVDAVAFETLIIIQNGGAGINLTGGSLANRIFGCRISDNADGVIISNTAGNINNTIATNSISSNTGTGIIIAGANATNNLINGNTILANGTAVSNSGTTTLIRSNIGVADN